MFSFSFFLGGPSEPTGVQLSHIMSKKCGTEREEVDRFNRKYHIFLDLCWHPIHSPLLPIIVKTGCVRLFMYGSFKRLYREDFEKVVQAPPMQLPGAPREQT